jgi:hypothetical protein
VVISHCRGNAARLEVDLIHARVRFNKSVLTDLRAFEEAGGKSRLLKCCPHPLRSFGTMTVSSRVSERCEGTIKP